MAERRMFSKRIIESAKFLKMPLTTQALYFHLGLHADDDGIVEAWQVLRSVGCTEDDLRVLVAKEFVKILNEDLVTYILDWNENNRIRPDRKIDSIYKDLLLSVAPNAKLIEKRERADKKQKIVELDNQWTTNGQPMDGIGKDRLGKDRLGKDRLGKDRLGKDRKGRFVPPTLEEIEAYCKERNSNVNPKEFFDYFDTGHWIDSKGHEVKNWKQKLITWEKFNTEPKKKADFDANAYILSKINGGEE